MTRVPETGAEKMQSIYGASFWNLSVMAIMHTGLLLVQFFVYSCVTHCRNFPNSCWPPSSIWLNWK